VATGLEPFQVLLPSFLVSNAEFVQVIPTVDSGVVIIVEGELDRVMTHRLDALDVDVFLADLQDFLPRPMSLHFGGW